MKEFKSRTHETFRGLLAKTGMKHCKMPGVSPAAANRLFHGVGSPSPEVIDTVAKIFGKQGDDLIKAWLEDQAMALPSPRKVVVLVSSAHRR